MGTAVVSHLTVSHYHDRNKPPYRYVKVLGLVSSLVFGENCTIGYVKNVSRQVN